MSTICQIIFLFVTLLLSAFFGEQGTEAATYYVATTGNDTAGNGSISAPWGSISKGIRSLRAGDMLYIRGGTYTLSNIYGNVASDTFGCQSGCPTGWATATSIRNYPGEAITIRAAGFNMDHAISTGGIRYVIFEGDTRANFVLDGQGNQWSNGFRVNNGTSFIRIKTLTVKNYGSDGIKGGIDCTGPTGRPNNIEILDTEIRNNGDDNGGTSPYHEHGIYPSCGDDWLIKGNDIVANYATGIHVYSGSTGMLNRFRIIGNKVEGRTGPSGTTAGIYVNGGTGHFIVNNLVIGKGNQLNKLTWGVMVGSTAVSPVVYNNTLYGLEGGIQLATSGSDVRNNLINNVNAYNIQDLGSNTKMNNLCTATEIGCSRVTTSPGFLSAGTNFALAVGSPAIDAGTTMSTVTNDLNGVPRPQGVSHDIGAYEKSSNGVLSPPKNLSVR
jgi:hypothetical protein